MNGLSREQLLEKLNELYIELDEYKEMEKDYIDLSYEMQSLEEVHIITLSIFILYHILIMLSTIFYICYQHFFDAFNSFSILTCPCCVR